jgi:hypothetical protein
LSYDTANYNVRWPVPSRNERTARRRSTQDISWMTLIEAEVSHRLKIAFSGIFWLFFTSLQRRRLKVTGRCAFPMLISFESSIGDLH